MIQLITERNPVSLDDRKAVDEWIAHRGLKVIEKIVAAQIAQLSAEAVNDLRAGQEDGLPNATANGEHKLKEIQRYESFLFVLEEVRQKQTYETVKISYERTS